MNLRLIIPSMLLLATVAYGRIHIHGSTVIEETAGTTTVILNLDKIIEGLKRTPKTVMAIPRGPKATIAVAKTPSKAWLNKHPPKGKEPQK